MRRPRAFKQYLKSHVDLGLLQYPYELSAEVDKLIGKVEDVYNDISHLPIKNVLTRLKEVLEVSCKNTTKEIYTISGRDYEVRVPFNIDNTIDNDRASLLAALSYVIISDYIDYVDFMLNDPNKMITESPIVVLKKFLWYCNRRRYYVRWRNNKQ